MVNSAFHYPALPDSHYPLGFHAAIEARMHVPYQVTFPCPKLSAEPAGANLSPLVIRSKKSFQRIGIENQIRFLPARLVVYTYLHALQVKTIVAYLPESGITVTVGRRGAVIPGQEIPQPGIQRRIVVYRLGH